MSLNLTFEKKMRLIGYYNHPNQTMHEESIYIEEAKRLAELLNKSFESLRNNTAVALDFKEILNSCAVFILKDEDSNLFAFFPCKNIARISDVVYKRNAVKQIPHEYKSWFIPGEGIEIGEIHDEKAKRYYISIPGSDFLITDNKTKKLLPLDWDKDDYVSVKKLSRIINDAWVQLEEYKTEDDCGDCDGYDYSYCDDSRCRNDCDGCGGRRYICNDYCFNHRYKRALRCKLNNDAITEELKSPLNILDIISRPHSEHHSLFHQYQKTLTRLYNRCKLLSEYLDISESALPDYISKMELCTMLNNGRENFKEEDSVAIYINNNKVLCVNRMVLKYDTKGSLFWKTHYLQSANDTYNSVTDSIVGFNYKIEFDTEEAKDKIRYGLSKISAIYLKSNDDYYTVEKVIAK